MLTLTALSATTEPSRHGYIRLQVMLGGPRGCPARVGLPRPPTLCRDYARLVVRGPFSLMGFAETAA